MTVKAVGSREFRLLHPLLIDPSCDGVCWHSWNCRCLICRVMVCAGAVGIAAVWSIMWWCVLAQLELPLFDPSCDGVCWRSWNCRCLIHRVMVCAGAVGIAAVWDGNEEDAVIGVRCSQLWRWSWDADWVYPAVSYAAVEGSTRTQVLLRLRILSRADWIQETYLWIHAGAVYDL